MIVDKLLDLIFLWQIVAVLGFHKTTLQSLPIVGFIHLMNEKINPHQKVSNFELIQHVQSIVNQRQKYQLVLGTTDCNL